MLVYIIFAVIVVLSVIFIFIVDIFIHNVDTDAPKVIAMLAIATTVLVSTIFYIVDFKVTRTDVEGVPVMATLTDKEIQKSKKHTYYYFYITCEGETSKQSVSAGTYAKYNHSDRIEGEIVYFTTGITKMHKTEYKFYY